MTSQWRHSVTRAFNSTRRGAVWCLLCLAAVTCVTCSLYQGRIQEFALGGRTQPLRSCPISSPPLPLKSRVPLKPASGLVERCKLLQWSCKLLQWKNECSALYSCEKATGGSHFEYSEMHVWCDVGPTRPPAPSISATVYRGTWTIEMRGHVFQYRCWVVLQPYPHGWSAVGKFSVDIQGR